MVTLFGTKGPGTADPSGGSENATKGGEKKMALDERIKKTWIDVQKRHDVPVNAIGMKIDPKDANSLRVWREEGIDKFVKK
jgi:hypothetical protein